MLDFSKMEAEATILEAEAGSFKKVEAEAEAEALHEAEAVKNSLLPHHWFMH